MILVRFQGKLFNITVIQLYAPTTNAKEVEGEWFSEDLKHLLELIPKRCPFHHRGLECESRKSRDNWKNRQVCLGIQNETGQKLTEFCEKNTLVIANSFFQEHKGRRYTWTSPNDQNQNRIDYILCS